MSGRAGCGSVLGPFGGLVVASCSPVGQSVPAQSPITRSRAAQPPPVGCAVAGCTVVACTAGCTVAAWTAAPPATPLPNAPFPDNPFPDAPLPEAAPAAAPPPPVSAASRAGCV